MTDDRPRRGQPGDGQGTGETDGGEGQTRYQQLRAESVLYRSLVGSIQDPVFVADDERTVVDCNPAFTERFGYALEDLNGERTDVLCTDATAFDAVAEELLTDADDPSVTRIVTYVTASGDTFPGETSVVPLRDDDGEVVAVVGLIRDLSERTGRDRERERTIAYLQGLYEVATDRDLDTEAKVTRLLELGPETLDLPPGYLTRIEVGDADTGDGTQRVIEASGDHELLQPGNSCPLAQSYCRKTIEIDGLLAVHDAVAEGWADDPAYELFDLGCYIGTPITVGGELYGTVLFAEQAPRPEPFGDAERTFLRLLSQLVSYELERDRGRRELEQQNERLEEFASIISHDLRNPLNVAQGRLDLAREAVASDHLDEVARAHERMARLIDDLLTLAREGTAAADLEPVHLGRCSADCWATVDTGSATLVTDADRTVTADRSQLQQLFENLFRNAVEHGGDDLTITVGTLPDGFYVEDDGVGIPEADRDSVFEAGYSTSHEGTGFGLRIVEQVVDAHGWDIRVTEGSEGGARFEVTGVEFTTG